jgi:hypothetical protein
MGHHLQGLARMAGLASPLARGGLRQRRTFPQPVSGWRLVTIVAVGLNLSLDRCEFGVQGLIFGSQGLILDQSLPYQGLETFDVIGERDHDLSILANTQQWQGNELKILVVV